MIWEVAFESKSLQMVNRDAILFQAAGNTTLIGGEET